MLTWLNQLWQMFYEKLQLLALIIIGVIIWEITKYAVKTKLPSLFKKQTEQGVKIQWKNVLIILLLAALIIAILT